MMLRWWTTEEGGGEIESQSLLRCALLGRWCNWVLCYFADGSGTAGCLFARNPDIVVNFGTLKQPNGVGVVILYHN